MGTTETRILSVLLALGLCGAAPVAPARAQQKATVVFSAGPTGGTWTPMAAATGEVVRRRFPEVDVQVEPGAALVNMEKIASSKTPAEVVYKITRAIVEGRESFAHVAAVMKGVTGQQRAESFGLPRHPGAERYYREAGLLK